MSYNGKLKMGEGIGGCCGGDELKDGGGSCVRLRGLRHCSLLLFGAYKAVVAAARWWSKAGCCRLLPVEDGGSRLLLVEEEER